MKKLIKPLYLGMILLFLLTPASTFNVTSAQPVNKASVIIGFKTASDAGLVRAHGGEVKYIYHYIYAIAASVPEQAVTALQKNPNVAYVEPDFKVYAIGHGRGKPKPQPTQPAQTIPWGIEQIGAPKVWATDKGTGVRVAILDTGIDTKHPDLKVVGGVTFVRGTKTYNDDNGHGTHCAGIVAALDNDIGVVGVAPEASLYAVKVLNRRGVGYLSDVINGIEWSIDNGMQVISMSFGSTSDSISLHDECEKAYGLGIVLVAAAGNNGPGENTVTYPAKYSSVIAVGATDKDDVVASWSSRGSELELTAPGAEIYSTYKGSIYETMSGTSMACPHVTGTVALILYKNSALTPYEVRSILQDTAIDLGSNGLDSAYGYGRVDAYAAVSSISSQ